VPKDFVYTGRTAYFYEPNNSQVTVFEKFEDSPLANALRFLWGQGSILQTFNVSACTERCLSADVDTQRSVLLKPRDPIPSVEVIQLTVEPDSGRVMRSIVFDPLGNRTEYRFSSVAFNAKVSEKKFAFRIPPGVDILKASPQN
jgi:outer membrane lipoprotein-sorting protein